ncbi:MAG: metal ABC transporter permease [Candidatus Sericytochromatia bacterium]|nr:metal ABC transporter permease [Candidatus Tanganyikabacteria bacterium]
MPEDASPLAMFVANWPLFRDPILVASIAGGVLGYLGVYILARRMVFVSAALTQSAGFGVAVAFLLLLFFPAAGLALDPRIWAIGMALATAWLLGRPAAQGASREGLLALAYLFAGACVLVMGTRFHQETHDIEAILFGTGVLVSPDDLALISVVGGLTLGLQVWWRRGFLFASLDPEGAAVRGLPVRWLDGLLMLQIAAMVSLGTRALGVLPVFAFSILPALAASLLVRGPRTALAVATLLGVACGAGGYLLAFLAEFPVGASQTLLAALPVFAALGLRPLRRA